MRELRKILVRDGTAGVEVSTQEAKLFLEPASPDAQGHAFTTQVMDRRDLLRDQDRVT